MHRHPVTQCWGNNSTSPLIITLKEAAQWAVGIFSLSLFLSFLFDSCCYIYYFHQSRLHLSVSVLQERPTPHEFFELVKLHLFPFPSDMYYHNFSSIIFFSFVFFSLFLSLCISSHSLWAGAANPVRPGRRNTVPRVSNHSDSLVLLCIH